MEKDQIFFLKDRGIVFINGKDAKEFLQNIVTNDINKVSDTSSCFASLLTPQGKYLFDFIIVKHKNGYFLDCEKKQTDKLIDRLNVYKLNSSIEILNLSNEFEVAVINKEKFLGLEGSKDEEGNTTRYNDDLIILDPRSKDLGARIIANLEKLTLSIKNLSLKSEDPKIYYSLSHKLGIPQVNTEKLREKIFGLECNFEDLNGIDFKKGCYVGQENTARMKLKNKLRRKLLPLKSNEKLGIDSDITFNKINIGKVLINEPYPFGLIKLFDPNFSDFKNKEILADNKKVIIIIS
tara:strand:- start:159 stop:1037 length:879 start_codon:yes stop_codon:yes gene_type:complete